MEKASSLKKTSLAALFIFTLWIGLLIMGEAEAREIQNESFYSEEKAMINVREILKHTSYKIDGDCEQHCPSACKIVNCISGTCFCEC